MDDSDEDLNSFIRLQESFSINFAELKEKENCRSSRQKLYFDSCSSDTEAYEIVPLTRHYPDDTELKKSKGISSTAIKNNKCKSLEKIETSKNMSPINKRSKKVRHKSYLYTQRLKILQNEFNFLKNLQNHYSTLEEEYRDLNTSYENFKLFDFKKAIKSLDESCKNSHLVIKKLSKISDENKILFNERKQKIENLTNSIGFLCESFAEDCNSSLFEINKTMNKASNEDSALNKLIKIRGRLRADNNARSVSISTYKSEIKELEMQIEVANEKQHLLKLKLRSVHGELERISSSMDKIKKRSSVANETQQSIEKLELEIKDIGDERIEIENQIKEELTNIDFYNNQSKLINNILKIYTTIEKLLRDAKRLEDKDMKYRQRNLNLEGELNAFKACIEANCMDTRAEINNVECSNNILRSQIRETKNRIMRLREGINLTRTENEKKQAIQIIFFDHEKKENYKLEDVKIILDTATAQRRARLAKIEKAIQNLPLKVDSAEGRLKSRQAVINKKVRQMQDDQFQLEVLSDETHGAKWTASALSLFALRRSISAELPFWNDNNTRKGPGYYAGLGRRWTMTIDKLAKYVF